MKSKTRYYSTAETSTQDTAPGPNRSMRRNGILLDDRAGVAHQLIAPLYTYGAISREVPEACTFVVPRKRPFGRFSLGG
jgi:hypothetical protein